MTFTLLAPRVMAQREGTQVFNIRGPMMAASCFPRNRRAIVNFTADLLISRRSQGRSTALLMRKDNEKAKWMTSFIDDLMKEVEKRVVAPFKILLPGDSIPETPAADEVAVITYGMTGLGDYENFQGLVAVHAFHLNPEAIADSAFNDRPPSKRPRLTFAKGSDRRFDWSGQRSVSQEDREKAEAMLYRMELDATAQAVHRVRPAIHPRLIITNIRTDPTPLLGPVTSVKNLNELRVRLHLPTDTRDARSETQARALIELVKAGVTVTEAAERLGIGRTKAQELLKKYGADLPVRKGRPPAQAPPTEGR